MPAKKQTKKQSSKVVNSKFGSLMTPRKLNLKIAALLIVVLAAVGVYLLFFAEAATNNCQTGDNNVEVCDVNMVAGDKDTVLSIGPEAEALGNQKWGLYYNTTFRAQKTAGNGAVPIHRVVNPEPGVSLHDWVTDTQKSAKEAKYGALVYEGVAFYAWNTQVKDTVPVYRISRAGDHVQHIFSVDKGWVDRILATDANNPNGWKRDIYGPFIAFYAYPPGYKVADKPNPYDCSIKENFLSDRCVDQRNALLDAEKAGTLPKDNTCPTTLTAYLAAPFPGQFEQSCQDKWNKYMQDCSIQENFLSDRCKTNRDALEAAYDCSIQANFLSDRCDAARNRLADAYDCSKQENFLSDRCDGDRQAFVNAAQRSSGSGRGGGGASQSRSSTSQVVSRSVDCSIQANFVSSACTEQRNKLALILGARSLSSVGNELYFCKWNVYSMTPNGRSTRSNIIETKTTVKAKRHSDALRKCPSTKPNYSGTDVTRVTLTGACKAGKYGRCA